MEHFIPEEFLKMEMTKMKLESFLETYLSENEKQHAEDYWEKILPSKRANRKKAMLMNVEQAIKTGKLLDFGNLNLPKGAPNFSSLPTSTKELLSAYKQLFLESSDAEKVHLLQIQDFELLPHEEAVSAPLETIALNETQPTHFYEADSSGNFGSPFLPSYLEKLAFFRSKYLNSHKK